MAATLYYHPESDCFLVLDPDRDEHGDGLEVEIAPCKYLLDLCVGYVCKTCRSKGFLPSITGVGCSFCDGTESGNPPEKETPK